MADDCRHVQNQQRLPVAEFCCARNAGNVDQWVVDGAHNDFALSEYAIDSDTGPAGPRPDDNHMHGIGRRTRNRQMCCKIDYAKNAVMIPDHFVAFQRGNGIFLNAQNLDNPIQTLTVVGTIYILINYALSRIAVWTERRLSRSSAAAVHEVEATTTGAGA